MRLKQALTTSYREMKGFAAPLGDIRSILWHGFILLMVMSGMFFLNSELGNANPLLLFLAGCAAVPIYLLCTVGAFFGGLFLAMVTVRLCDLELLNSYKSVVWIFYTCVLS